MTSRTQATFDELDRLRVEAGRLGLEPPGGRRAGWTLEELRHAVAAERSRAQELLVVRPGDKLLVRVDPHTDVERIRELRDVIAARFTEAEVTVIAADQLAVVRD